MPKAGGRSSDSGLPPAPPSRPEGQWHSGGERLPSQRRDRPGFAPASLTARLLLSAVVCPSVQAAVWRWGSVVAWAALIFVLSSISAFGTDLGFWDYVLPKAVHLVEFAVLGFLLVWATGRESASFLLGVAYAASDEVHQHFVPGRHGSTMDVAIDAVGLAIGIYLARRVGLSRVDD